MGRSQAEGFAEAVADGQIGLSTALAYHLESNHYPPIPYAVFGGMATEAINRASAGEWDGLVQGPDNWRHSRYGQAMPVWAVVEELHLESFVQPDDETLSAMADAIDATRLGEMEER